MENVLQLETLWSPTAPVLNPRGAILEIHKRTMKVVLEKEHPDDGSDLDISSITTKAMQTVEAIFKDASREEYENIVLYTIIQRLRNSEHTPTRHVRALIAMWFEDVVPYLIRDQGSVRSTQRRYQGIGNQGLVAMLLTANNWTPPVDSRLRKAALIANSATSMIFAAYILGSGPGQKGLGQFSSLAPSSVSIRSFVRCTWQVARVSLAKGPGHEFLARKKEAKISSDGKRLLVRVGRRDWKLAPYWHPMRHCPGSPWNKFLMNKNQTVFVEGIPDSQTVAYKLSSPAMILAATYEDYYTEIRRRADEVDRPRKMLCDDDARLQHSTLATATGLWYPDTGLHKENSSSDYDLFQEYMDLVPMGKQPVADRCGHATLPLLSSIGHAFKHHFEPPYIEDDLWIMEFGG